MEQLIILLVIGAIGFVNWLIKLSAEARERKKIQRRIDQGEASPVEREVWADPLRRTPEPSAREVEDPSESMRKLMEALGLPMENEPPKPIQRRPEPRPEPVPDPPRPVMREPVFTPPPLPQPDPYAQAREFRPTPPPVVTPRRQFREVEEMPALESLPTPAVDLHHWTRKKKVEPIAVEVERRYVHKMLSSPQSLREAMILREVLGPPKALQD